MSSKNPISVEVIAKTDADPTELASHAASMCYQPKAPVMGEVIKVKERLFDVGHHTTLQNHSSTSKVENIAVGDVTTGIHLVSPFYNSDQRSGRFCAKMFLNPDYHKIEEYISAFWPEVEQSVISDVMRYVANGVDIFHGNIECATEITTQFLKEERPFISDRSLRMNAPKIAQEQMRMFIPIIFPTGLDFTVNTTALAAMYRSAWTPAMKGITDKLVHSFLKEYPNESYMFNPESRRQRDWSFKLGNGNRVLFSPSVRLKEVDDDKGFVMPQFEDMHPVDLLHFMPEYMDNSIRDIRTVVEISMATMGQDQRHRTVRRGIPRFSGNFYLPAVPREFGLESTALYYMKEWKKLKPRIPGTLFMVLAPYGAMVTYEKNGSFNAITHEQVKRLCWCAQEEIYQICRKMRNALIEYRGGDSPLLQVFQPPCYKTGKCVEGARYCGRDLRNRTPETYFPERKV